jgi:hypothetical protein
VRSGRPTLGMWLLLIDLIQKLRQRVGLKACVYVQEKELVSPTLLVVELEENTRYELLADSEYTNDTVIFELAGQRIITIIRGNEFSEEGSTFFFDLDVIPEIVDIVNGGMKHLTLADLEMIQFEIYML